MTANALHHSEEITEEMSAEQRERIRALEDRNRLLENSEQRLRAGLAAARRLQRISTQSIRGTGVQALYEQVLDAAATTLRADFASLQLADPDQPHGELRLLAHRGFNAEAARFWERVGSDSQSACGMALRSGRRVTIPDVRECDSMAGSRDLQLFAENGIRAVQTTPLLSRSGIMVGMLSTHWREVHGLTATEARFLDILARLVADLLERAHTEKALRLSEERFRLFVENVREYALVQTDSAGRIMSWNPGAERLFGYESAEVLGEPFQRLIMPNDAAIVPPAVDFAPFSDEAQSEAAGWMARSDGSRFWARWITQPMYDETNSVRGSALIIRDETTRQQTDDAIQAALARKNELLKDVHHRVKNNLQIILSLMNLQSGRIEEPRTLEPFDETRNRVQSIASIYELLYHSDTFASIDVAEYARRLAKDIVRFYGAREWMETEVTGGGITLEPDRAVPFGLLLNELISNVCKHAFRGRESGKLTIALHCDGGHIVLTVADNGIGLPPDFDYFRVSSLGLQLVHSLARQLRANIEIQVEDGTRVIVGLPQWIKEDQT